MFKRIRHLRISLAAKCQLLFGAAVILIIAAALYVPWHRMEQLTEQLNEQTAAALADYAVSDHTASKAIPAQVLTSSDNGTPSTEHVEATRIGPSTRALATTAPAAGSSSARLVGLTLRREPAEPGRFDHRAIAHFAKHPDSLSYSAYYDRPDGTYGYRYAQPLRFNQQRCIQCHSIAPMPEERLSAASSRPASVPGASNGPSLLPALEPSDTPAGGSAPLVGVVSVDFASRIDTNQLALNRIFILMAGMLAGALAIVTFYFITTRLILQPVRVLQETAEKVSQGDLNIRSDISTGDEFQQLSETFNTMLANLKTGADQLRAVNKSLDLKLGQLAESNVALYESNRLKSEFLANVSHELRTPLNSILGFADLLRETLDAGADSRSARYVTNILQSSRHLLDLINDLLDLAKIEAGRMEVHSEPLVLSDLLEGLTNILKPLYEPKKLSIALAVGPDVPIISTDPGKLQQVLYNFLSNAIKFSPPGGTIELSAGRDNADHVRVSVTDSGPGIPLDKQQTIFEKFRQLDGSVTRAHSGTGLGLAISKELSALMGGEIGVSSNEGAGATFWILLPLNIQGGARDVRSRLVLT